MNFSVRDIAKYKKIIVGLDDKTSKEGILTDKQILEKNPNYQALKEKNTGQIMRDYE